MKLDRQTVQLLTTQLDTNAITLSYAKGYVRQYCQMDLGGLSLNTREKFIRYLNRYLSLQNLPQPQESEK